MTAIFTKEAANALKSHKAKENLGCESLTQQIHTLQTELLRLSRETVDAFDNDLDVESSDLPIYDRQSTISQLDRAATELALTQGRVDVHSDIFDKVVNQVTEASEKWVAWEKTNKEKENQSPDHTPDDDEQEGDGVKDANENAPKVPDITKLYATTLAKSLPEPTKKSRALMLKKSRDLRKHKETLLWMLMPEIDLGDSDKWWISLGSLVSKHVGRKAWPRTQWVWPFGGRFRRRAVCVSKVQSQVSHHTGLFGEPCTSDCVQASVLWRGFQAVAAADPGPKPVSCCRLQQPPAEDGRCGGR